ncbi:fungal hydrophobin-domain-containing protein [Crucibulum laeve]|uniref:Hydrophobin n=1 Tax=Crucibulum laeve TaxID=68775 RepID=A0A5C3LW58_9AGAR|nr:fungal hydrophobin-domain-containing protein [Crucibulum laeve]
MFIKIAFLSTLAAVAFAAPGWPSAAISNSCNSGPVQCCDSLQTVSQSNQAGLASLLGVVAQGLTGQVGLQCNPITGIGLGSGSVCQSSAVCCSGNNFNGLIALGCNPISIGI